MPKVEPIGFRSAPRFFHRSRYPDDDDDVDISSDQPVLWFNEDYAVVKDSPEKGSFIYTYSADWDVDELPVYERENLPSNDELIRSGAPGAVFVQDSGDSPWLMVFSNDDVDIAGVGMKRRSDQSPEFKPVSPGTYRYQDGEVVRVGDTKIMHRYHGSAKPIGTVIKKFDTTKFGSIYTAVDPMVAIEYTDTSGWLVSTPAPGEEGLDREPQLYVLTLTPDVIFDGGDCSEEEGLDVAADIGADVIECPDYWEQPETIVTNSNVISIDNAYTLKFDDENDGGLVEIVKITNNPDTEYDRLIYESLPYEKMVHSRWGSGQLTESKVAKIEEDIRLGKQERSDALTEEIRRYKERKGPFLDRQKSLYQRLDKSVPKQSRDTRSGRRLGRGRLN